ncbi:hypothetical protein LTR85_011600 [Meristemomyces frigidus]|nr:hypothetical protein LTR85_011600 [Meristemomyces frigidus]
MASEDGNSDSDGDFDPSQVEVTGYSLRGRRNLKYDGPGQFDYAAWCEYVGVRPGDSRHSIHGRAWRPRNVRTSRAFDSDRPIETAREYERRHGLPIRSTECRKGNAAEHTDHGTAAKGGSDDEGRDPTRIATYCDTRSDGKPSAYSCNGWTHSCQ